MTLLWHHKWLTRGAFAMALLALTLSANMAAHVSATASEPEENAPEVPPVSLEQRIANGHKLAQDKCASCHSINKQGDSPNRAAPPFRSFANKWPLESLEEALAEGIVTGHEEMPEFVLTPPQIDAFLEFLRTLQQKQEVGPATP